MNELITKGTIEEMKGKIQKNSGFDKIAIVCISGHQCATAPQIVQKQLLKIYLFKQSKVSFLFHSAKYL